MLPGTADTVGDVVPQTFYDANGEVCSRQRYLSFLVTTFLSTGWHGRTGHCAAGDYEFHMLNGSDLRFYVLESAILT